jgi:glutaredoxin
MFKIGDKGVVIDSLEGDWIDVDFGDAENDGYAHVHTLYEYEAKIAPPVDLSNKKINVKRYADEQGITLEQAHQEIQGWLFENGCKWISGEKEVSQIDVPYLFIDTNFDITWSNDAHWFEYQSLKKELTFTTERSVKLTPVLVEPPVETIELNGKKYDKKELEKALQHIKPLV